jgi:two-component system sensor histidine kinase UhpB
LSKKIDDLELLLVEDNPSDLFLLRQMLRSSPLKIKKIYETSRIEEACQIVNSKNISLALLDLSLPDSFGIDTYLDIKARSKKIPVIILTGLKDADFALQAIKEGAQDYLVKGEFNSHWLSKSIQYSMERMQHIEMVRESEEKYRQLFNRNPFPSMIVDMITLKILEVNDSAVEKYGYTRQEFMGITLDDLRVKDDVTEMTDRLATDNQRKNKPKLIRQKKKNGEIVFMEFSYYPVTYFGKTAMQAQMNDITERILLEKELKEEQELKHRQITAAVLAAQEKERTAIGEELHDNINQIITSARLYVDMAMRRTDNEHLLKKAMQYTLMAIEENRKLSKSLILPQLKGEGLFNSLLELKNELKQTSSLRINFYIDDLDENLFSDQAKVSLYRIVQEQLNNILKHAEARSILVKLYRENNKIILSIKDNGKGFIVSERRNGVGLTNISSRAEILNGMVEIDSAPGKGCTLKVIMDMGKNNA